MGSNSTPMFFKRVRPTEITFEERLKALKEAGFSVDALGGGRVRVSRSGCAAVIEDVPGAPPRIAERPGVIVAGEIGCLIDGGFQKFFETPSGKRKAALAHELKAIHDFQEDLGETLGLISLYNESLGTVSTKYLYDRVKDRDHGVPTRPWEAS